MAWSDLINQTVGDALSDLLMVEAMLAHEGISLQEWDAFYEDLPNRLIKVHVKDKSSIVTANADTVVIRPEELQNQISKLCSHAPKARSFVRPSGTEDVVRVYAEDATQDAADRLAMGVADAVLDFVEGIGDRPTNKRNY